MNPLIARLEIAVRLSDDDRTSLQAVFASTRRFEKGRDVVREADQPDQVYAMLDGWAARCKGLPDGSRPITAFLMPGDLCNGETLFRRRMDYSAVALTPVIVATATRDALIRLTGERPRLAQAFWSAAQVEAATSRAWIVNLGRRGAYSRLAHLACELHARLSRLDLVSGSECNLPFTQEQFGQALGLTSVHVNRVLKRLREERMMQFHNRTLTVLDIDRLRAVAGFDPAYLQEDVA